MTDAAATRDGPAGAIDSPRAVAARRGQHQTPDKHARHSNTQSTQPVYRSCLVNAGRHFRRDAYSSGGRAWTPHRFAANRCRSTGSTPASSSSLRWTTPSTLPPCASLSHSAFADITPGWRMGRRRTKTKHSHGLDTQATLRRYDPSGFSGQDRLSYDIFSYYVDDQVKAERWRQYAWPVNQLLGVHTRCRI